MVDFVRPNFLGNKTEFSNMFERPIMNGQCQDSTAEDMKIMKHRAYVLHNLLEGFVQRSVADVFFVYGYVLYFNPLALSFFAKERGDGKEGGKRDIQAVRQIGLGQPGPEQMCVCVCVCVRARAYTYVCYCVYAHAYSQTPTHLLILELVCY